MADQTQQDQPGIDHPDVQALLAKRPLKGHRSDTILKILNAAGKSGWTNHEILRLGSQLSMDWKVTHPAKNMYDHWSRLFGMLRNVRSHYPAPAQVRASREDRHAG